MIKQNTMNYTPTRHGGVPSAIYYFCKAEILPQLQYYSQEISPASYLAVRNDVGRIWKQKDLSAAKDSIPMERHYEIEKQGKNIIPG
jgi:hypothetical protein